MTTEKSISRLHAFLVFVFIYALCLAIVFAFDHVWDALNNFSHKVDSVLDNAGLVFADGESDPAGLWVIFGVPFVVATVIFFLIKKLR